MAKQVVTAIVTSGGGWGAVYHSAALSVSCVEESFGRPQIAAGTSGGAFTALWLGSHKGLTIKQKMDHLTEFFINTRRKDVWGLRILGFTKDVLLGFLPKRVRKWLRVKDKGYGLFHSKKLKKLLEKYYDPQFLQSNGMLLRLPAVNLQTGNLRAFTEKEDAVMGALASAAYPILVQPELHEGGIWVDGGARDVTPWAVAYQTWKENFPDTLLHMRVITTVPKRQSMAPMKGSSLFDYLTRLLSIIMSEVSVTDLQFPDDPDVRIDLLQPENDLPASATVSDAESVKRTVEIAQRDAKDRWVRVTDWEEV